MLSGSNAAAQQKPPTDTTDKITVQILNAEKFIGTRTDSSEQTKLVGNVHLKQGDNDMVCDSAYINLATNNVEAFGNVHITQPGGTEVLSDYLRYIGNKKLAYLKGNVKLNDGKNSLWSDEVTYDLGSKVAVYNNGGTLQSDATALSSNKGNYNVSTKEARFIGEVIVTDPSYNVTSEDLGYNTGSKIVRFFSPSVVTNNKSTLRTTGGTYDTKNERANFTSRTSLQDKEQYLEGDKIDYDRNTGYGKATGNVIAIDTAQHTTMWSGYATYNEQTRIMISTMKPVLRQMKGKDSLFIRADTFYSAPDLSGKRVHSRQSAKDTVGKTVHSRQSAVDRQRSGKDTGSVKKSRQGRKGEKATTEEAVLTAPEPVADSTTPRFFAGYHHVLIWSDSMQGRCDSIYYSEKDSVMRMIKDPVAWSRRTQLTGDTISLFLGDSNKIKRVFIPENALIVSLAGPEKAELYDQVQGKTLTAFFVRNTIKEMIVKPNAQNIYYPKDDSGAYLGVNESQSERMRVFFREEKVRTILLEQQITQKMTPLEQADLPNMRLSRFKWLEDKRPKSREELFK